MTVEKVYLFIGHLCSLHTTIIYDSDVGSLGMPTVHACVVLFIPSNMDITVETKH